MNSRCLISNRGWTITFWIYFFALLTIFALAYLRMIPVKIACIPYYDALGHYFLLGITGYLAHRSLDRRRMSWRGYSIPLGPLLVCLFAIFEESLQTLSPYRTFSLLDLGANISGIIFFYWLDRTLPAFSEIDFLSVTKRFLRLLITLSISALFPVTVFLTLGLTQGMELRFIHRYDLLFIVFLFFQVFLVLLKFETLQELRVIVAFHILGLLLEIYKVNFGAWSYPGSAWSKIMGVPLYSGFMYGSVAGFLIQVWKRLHISLSKWPATSIVSILGLLIYLNFFSMNISKEFRVFLVFSVLFIFSRSSLEFTNTTKRRSIPLVFTFSGLGLFVWIAENIVTYLGAWAYPYQLEQWQMVYLSKINSWFLLGIISFILVAELIKKGGTR